MKYKLLIVTVVFLGTFMINAPAQIITTVVGGNGGNYSGDGGPAIYAQLNWPVAVALDSSGDLFIADLNNDVIREVTAGIINTVAGNTLTGYEGDGLTAEIARLNYPVNVKTDKKGNFYIADQFNHVIRKVVDTSNIISTIAGNGFEAGTGLGGYSGDGGQATNAEFYSPAGIALDKTGNLYISDIGNSVVRRVDTSGIITTIAGNGSGSGYSGDGGLATNAKLSQPEGITVDNTGNLFIADQYNNVVRKVSTAGIISTVAGNGYGAGTTTHTGGYNGDGGQATAAELSGPADVAVDASGNLYIADQNNMVIRKVSASGVITTFAGNGTAGYSGDGGNAIYAQLKFPSGVAVDSAGDVFIADFENNAIREVIADSPGSTAAVQKVAVAKNNLQILLNPNNGSFAVIGNIGGSDQTATITVMDLQGQVMYKSNITVQNGNINTKISLGDDLPGGVYVLRVNSGNETNASQFVIEK
jgi:trimeric autotransporter adhesin